MNFIMDILLHSKLTLLLSRRSYEITSSEKPSLQEQEHAESSGSPEHTAGVGEVVQLLESSEHSKGPILIVYTIMVHLSDETNHFSY